MANQTRGLFHSTILQTSVGDYGIIGIECNNYVSIYHSLSFNTQKKYSLTLYQLKKTFLKTQCVSHKAVYSSNIFTS